ncbi:hypothetical protein C0J52_19792 [Blattella germanica]|nr:hypothetical protein C0J52_19792 [Blattella germanica]
MEINMGKPVQMTFRTGGREVAEDRIYLGTELLTSVNSYKYLGLTLQTIASHLELHKIPSSSCHKKTCSSSRPYPDYH